MNSLFSPDEITGIIRKYRVHLLIFLLALFIALTIAHPAVLLTDEFITTNQLRQLHAGHQIIVNEGKYGLSETGNMSGYFGYRSNMLGYTLFLPMVSLPAFWIIDLFGPQFAYFILVVWAFSALALLVLINQCFPRFSSWGTWRWPSILIPVIFLIFFINLVYYSPFLVDAMENYPEILAIVFTNILLLALSAVLIYEICRTIFEDTAYSFFGAVVCLSSSSYFLWSTFCKDHILVLPIFAGIVLCLVSYVMTDEYWYLPLAFLLCGTLAWIRPELAFCTVILVCGIWCVTLIRYFSKDKPGYSLLAAFLSPVFTLIGALPFFLNNLLITKNIFLPVQSVYLSQSGSGATYNMSESVIRVAGVKSLDTVIAMFVPSVPSSPVEALYDLGGILFYPVNGSFSLFATIPFALAMVLFAVILIGLGRLRFSRTERNTILVLLLVSAGVFLAYASQIHILNVDMGIIPDIRYYSPVYFPLTIVGLIILKKTGIMENSDTTIRQMCSIGVAGTAVTVFVLPLWYVGFFILAKGYTPISRFFTAYILVVTVLALVAASFTFFFGKGKEIAAYLIILLCLLPFFWQITMVFFLFSYSGFAGHIFWIPLVGVMWTFIAIYSAGFPLFIQSLI